MAAAGRFDVDFLDEVAGEVQQGHAGTELRDALVDRLEFLAAQNDARGLVARLVGRLLSEAGCLHGRMNYGLHRPEFKSPALLLGLADCWGAASNFAISL